MTRQRSHVDTVAGFLAGTCGSGTLAVRRSLPSPTTATAAEWHSAAALIDTTADDPSRDACDGTAVRTENHRPTRAAGGAAVSAAGRVLTFVRRCHPLTARAIGPRWSPSTLEVPSAPRSRSTSSSVAFASATILVTPHDVRTGGIILVAQPGASGSAGRRDHGARPVRRCHQRRAEVAHTASDSTSRDCINRPMSTPSKLSATAAYVGRARSSTAHPRQRLSNRNETHTDLPLTQCANGAEVRAVERVALLASRPYVDGVWKLPPDDPCRSSASAPSRWSRGMVEQQTRGDLERRRRERVERSAPPGHDRPRRASAAPA